MRIFSKNFLIGLLFVLLLTGTDAAPVRGQQTALTGTDQALVSEMSVASEPEAFTERKHKVLQDDTLYSLARKYGLTVKDLAAANGIEPPYKLLVGKALHIPSQGEKKITRKSPPVKMPPKAEDAPIKEDSSLPPSKVTTEKKFEEAAVIKIEDFADWSLVCTDQEVSETCSLVQNRVKQVSEGEKSVLIARIFLTDLDGKQVPHLRLFTPLEVWLPSGFSLKLDDLEEIRAPFLICVQNGCMTDLGLGEEFIPTVLQTKKLYVAYKRSDKTQTTVELTMAGFADGLAALSGR